MNERDIDKLIENAREIAEELWAVGRMREAETIRRLCASRVQSRETNRRLHRDNLALRRDYEKLCGDLPK